MMIGWILLALIAVFVAVLLLRAAQMKPVATNYAPRKEVDIDGAKMAEHLAQMVRIPTISNYDESAVDDAKFVEFRALLQTLYPQVHAVCKPILCGKTGLLFHLKGKNAAAPIVLMAHYDVVPVNAENWKHPPFSGEIFENELWGRGTIDTKITLLGTLEAAEKLLCEKFTPQNDVYFAFAGDEEVGGHGAKDIIAYFKQNNITPAMVLDEGGAVVEGVFPGVKEPIAVIGIGEKGMMNVEITAKSAGGHASHPIRPSAIGRMSKAVLACENHPFKAHLTLPIQKLFATVGPHAPFALRIVLANLWCFGGLLCTFSEKLGGEINAMMRTTMAFTMTKGSKQINVIPNEASAGLNMRLINTDTPDSVKQALTAHIADDKITVNVVHAQAASPYSSTEGAHWDALASAVANTWQGCLVSPYLMIACSDSRNYNGFCKDIYKFSAMALSGEQRGLIHNDNERIPVSEIAKTVAFYVRFLQSL
ncbi:MAG: M20/M25/M40 family metallo-hydrolase [Ruthenibacterium sp.]